jgi:hypothetical protein
MSLFDQRFLSLAGRAPSTMMDRLSHGVASWRRRRLRRRARRLPLPFDNHLRRDLGLPPVDKGNWPR